MEKNADFIRKKEFHIVFKGYKPDEVDKFLDILSVEFERLLKKNRELQESLDKLKFGSGEEDIDLKKVIQDALVSAHRIAEEIKSQAKKEAEEFISKRKQEEEKALEEIRQKKLQLEEAMIILRSKYEELRDKIKKIVEDFNQYISEIDSEYFTEVKDERKEELEEVVQDTGKEVFSEENDELEQTKEEDFKFDNYKIGRERESGFYFIKESEKGKIKEAQVESATTKDEQKPEEAEKLEDSELKKPRKKIDIANPDIIENFFKATDD